MSNVYITQEVLKRTLQNEKVLVYDFSAAKQYGDLHIVVPFGLPVENLQETAFKALQNFTEEDYILSVGDPAVVALVVAVATVLTDGRFTLLKWDRSKYNYVPIRIDLT